MELKANVLDIDTYLYLRDCVHWKVLTRQQAQRALDNSLYTIVAYEDEQPVGMGRIVGDGAVICYVQDLVIHPDYQRAGAGSAIIKELERYVRSIMLPDTTMMLDLMCAKGREEFYRKHEFIARPTKELGPGMIKYLE